METTLGCEFVIFILMKSRLFRKFKLATFINKGKKINTCKLPFINKKSLKNFQIKRRAEK